MTTQHFEVFRCIYLLSRWGMKQATLALISKLPIDDAGNCGFVQQGMLVLFQGNVTVLSEQRAFAEAATPIEQDDEALYFVVRRGCRGHGGIVTCGIGDELFPTVEIYLKEVELMLATNENLAQIEDFVAIVC